VVVVDVVVVVAMAVADEDHFGHDLLRLSRDPGLTVDLFKPAGNVVSLSRSSGPNQYTMRTTQQDTAEEQTA
jgi:hypothetical protein